MPPPVTATLPDGVVLELRPLAAEITDRHLRRHPEDTKRYGELARDWGIRDTQHVLNWAALDAETLAGTLEAGAAFVRAWTRRASEPRGERTMDLACAKATIRFMAAYAEEEARA